jgi:cyclophilin family peptidyl-prolyl cis-trans isomerase
MKPASLLLALAIVFLLAACVIEPTPSPRPIRTPARTLIGSPTPRATNPRTLPAIGTPAPRLTPGGGGTSKQYSQPPPMTIDTTATYTATISTNKGDITLELFASETPITVNNFVFLAREGFYNGTTFHRVIKGFMIQGGDPKGDGTGDPGYRFQDEPVNRRYTRGVVAMANAGPDTNGSQFFIVHGTAVDLQPLYTIFGQVTQGIDTVDRLADTPVKANPFNPRELSVPTETLLINSIQITETKRR